MVLKFNPMTGELNDVLKYVRFGNVDDSPLAGFDTTTPTDVPGMSANITKAGDYVFFGILNLESNQNLELEFFIALNGVTVATQLVSDEGRKKKGQSIQGTFALDNLVPGDVVTFQLDTDGDSITLTNRRWLAQSWT